MKIKLYILTVLSSIIYTACSSDSSKRESSSQYKEIVVQEQVAVVCPVCNGTGQVFDFELGMSTMCMNCYNGYVYETRNVKKKLQTNQWDGAFTGNDHNKGKLCSELVGAGSVYCSCSGCEPGHWDAFTCINCKHKCENHTR